MMFETTFWALRDLRVNVKEKTQGRTCKVNTVIHNFFKWSCGKYVAKASLKHTTAYTCGLLARPAYEGSFILRLYVEVNILLQHHAGCFIKLCV